MTSFLVKPEWHPIETAPKDRPIWLRTVSADFDTGAARHNVVEAYWGVMRAFPTHDPEWLPVGGEDNSSINGDEDFVKRVTFYADRYGSQELVHYRGNAVTHWADIIRHSVTISQPNYDKPRYETVRTETIEK